MADSVVEEGLASGKRSDADLLLASAGEPDAFGEFYERHIDFLLGFFYRRTACPETAADLAAETFASAYLSRRSFRDVGAPGRAWIMAIARRVLARSIDKARLESSARRRLQIASVPLDSDTRHWIAGLADLSDLRAELREEFSHLSDPVAEAVFLRVALDWPYADVASKLGCSEGAARVRVMRGLTQLQSQMKEAV